MKSPPEAGRSGHGLLGLEHAVGVVEVVVSLMKGEPGEAFHGEPLTRAPRRGSRPRRLVDALERAGHAIGVVHKQAGERRRYLLVVPLPDCRLLVVPPPELRVLERERQLYAIGE